MTRYSVRSCGKADGGYEGEIESAACWAQLLFEAQAQIAKPVANPDAVSSLKK